MFFLILCIFIIVMCGLFSFILTDTDKCLTPGSKRAEKLTCMVVGLIIPTVLLGFICCCIWGASYDSYLDLHKYRVSIEVRATAVSFYSEKGVQEFNIVPGKEITDLKYNQYQDTVGKLIRDLRDTVETYNRILVSKQQMKSSPFWSWMIIAPDEDMKPIVLSQFLKKGN